MYFNDEKWVPLKEFHTFKKQIMRVMAMQEQRYTEFKEFEGLITSELSEIRKSFKYNQSQPVPETHSSQKMLFPLQFAQRYNIKMPVMKGKTQTLL